MCRKLPSFDEMMRLAQHRPDEFERLRHRVCEAAINDAPESLRPQLRGLQFRIDMESRRLGTPLARCIRISTMMHESFARLDTLLNTPPETAEQSASPATILAFKPRQSQR